MILSDWLYRALKKPKKKTIQYDVILFKVDRIGDFVLAYSALNQLIRKYETKRICLLVSSLVEPLAQRYFPTIDCYTVSNVDDPRLRSMFFRCLDARKRIGHITARTCIILRHQRNNYHHVLLSVLGSSKTVAIKPTGIWARPSGRHDFPITDLVHVSPTLQSSDTRQASVELLWHLSLLRHVVSSNLDVDDVLPRLPEKASLGTYLLVSPFGSDAIRSYALDRLADVLRCFMEETDLRVVLCGTTMQMHELSKLGDKIRSEARSGNIEVLIPNSLDHFFDLIAAARGVFCMETAPAHIATAMNKPLLVLIGGGHFNHFGPWSLSKRQVWMTKRLDCFDCNWSCKYDYSHCITDLPVSHVCGALIRIVRNT